MQGAEERRPGVWSNTPQGLRPRREERSKATQQMMPRWWVRELRPILLGHQGEIGGYEGEGIDHQKAGAASV
jgi:hypothetical protein